MKAYSTLGLSCWKYRVSNGPGREVALDAHRINDPGPLAAIRQDEVRGEVRVDAQHPQVRVTGVDRCQGRGRDQGDGHCEVGHEVADGPEQPRRAAEVGEVGRQTKSVHEEQGLDTFQQTWQILKDATVGDPETCTP